MPDFRIVLIEHGYSTTDLERDCIEERGGKLFDYDTRPAREALEACKSADGVLVRRMVLDREILEKYMPSVKVIVRYGVGVDNIDLDAATDLKIIVSRVPDYSLEEVSDHAIAMMWSLARGILFRDRVMKSGGWDAPKRPPIYRLCERTAGILAFGQIARRTARKLKAWNMRVISHDPYIDKKIIEDAGVEPVDFGTLLAESDYLFMHAPMLPENQHLINAAALSMMKDGAYLVNTGRGPLVDAEALAEVLASGKLSGAGLDVFEQEPLSPDSPLRKISNLALSDHIAWYSEQSQRQLQLTAAEEVARGAAGGLPKTIANPEVLQKLGRFDEWIPDAAYAWMQRRAEVLAQNGQVAP